MFGVKTFKPWVGKYYGNNDLKVMVLGYSRYDELYTDYDIVNEGVGGRSHTNFAQTILRKKHYDDGYDPFQFWHTAIFYNYNTTFFPGKPRVTPKSADLGNELNSKMLRKMLAKYKPTHCIVWGKRNWENIDIEGVDWGSEKYIPNLSVQHPYYSVNIEDNQTIFTYVKHPSTGFSYDYWSEVIKVFLNMKPTNV